MTHALCVIRRIVVHQQPVHQEQLPLLVRHLRATLAGRSFGLTAEHHMLIGFETCIRLMVPSRDCMLPQKNTLQVHTFVRAVAVMAISQVFGKRPPSLLYMSQ
jgi:hypothetical protein